MSALRQLIGICIALAAAAGCGGNATSSTVPCSGSVAAFCTAQPDRCDFSALTVATSPVCSMTTVSADCDGFAAVHVQGVDTSQDLYFTTSRELVAAFTFAVVLGGKRCVAGPSSGFTEPSCLASSYVRVCGP
jgi:hypothetical protein